MAISKAIIDGKISYEVFVKIRDKSGKQRALRRRGFTSEREAKRAEFELKKNLFGEMDKIGWTSWVEIFNERYRVQFQNSTYLNYKLSLEKWVTPIWGEKLLDEITSSDVHKMVFETIEGMTDHSRKTMLKIIKRVFSIAVEDGLLTRNPAIGIKIRIAEANQAVLNKNEIDILLKEAKAVNHRFYNHWVLAILTGMRNGELHALRWTDVNFVSGIITISKSWTRFNGEGPTKTAKNRVCPLSQDCRLFLQELKLQTGNTDYVLPRLWEWDQGQQAVVLKDFCKGIGITPIKFHDLRATFITQMLSNGVALAKVMAIVGHSSLKTTQGYLRLSGKDVEGATEALQVRLPTATEDGGKILELKRT